MNAPPRAVPRPPAAGVPGPGRPTFKPAPTAQAQPPAPARSPFAAAMARKPNTPIRVVTLPASAWAETYPDRRTQDCQVGLRLYAEGEALAAKAAAAQRASKLHPPPGDDDLRTEAYNSTLMAEIVARTTCDPTNIALPFFGAHEGHAIDTVPLALTPRGLEFLFEQVEILMEEESPVLPSATDEDLAWLAGALCAGASWNRLDAAAQRRLRRKLGSIVEALRPPDT